VVHQECGAGVLAVEVDPDGARLSGGTLSQRPGPDVAALAAAVGLGPADVTGRPVHLVGTGIDFAQLEVRPGAVERAFPHPQALDALLAGVQGGVSVLAWDAAAGSGTVRVFAAGLGWHEDPATGSAALGTGVWLAAAGLVPADGTTGYTIRQGELLGRPSLLSCTVTTAGGRATSATVSGAVVPIAAGTIRVPG
jgi:trans-2,3-dihydro-3-hydroxyanthranilate isomerase